MSAKNGTPKNMPNTPNSPPPTMTEKIIMMLGKPSCSPIIFGPKKFPSNCCKTIIKMPNHNACQGLLNSKMKMDGTAPMIGPKNGIIFVSPIINAIKYGNSKPRIKHPIKQISPMIMESRDFPATNFVKMERLV